MPLLAITIKFNGMTIIIFLRTHIHLYLATIAMTFPEVGKPLTYYYSNMYIQYVFVVNLHGHQEALFCVTRLFA